MIFIFIAFIGGGILAAVLINRFLVRRFPERLRKAARVITVVICVLISIAQFMVYAVQKTVTEIVNTKTAELEAFILDAASDSPLITKGYDLAEMPQAFEEFKSSMPKTLGVDSGFSGMFIDRIYQNFLTKAFDTVQGRIDSAASTFTDINNRITFSSIINGIKSSILYRFNLTMLYIRLFLLGIVFIYFIYCVYTSVKEQKKI